MQAMIDSDSDSYGSEGGLKEKPVVIKKRGGRKRNKGGDNQSQITGQMDSADEQDLVSEATVA